jgi:hypothetical protein
MAGELALSGSSPKPIGLGALRRINFAGSISPDRFRQISND